MDEIEVPWVEVGSMQIQCPVCPDIVLLPVRARLVSNEIGQQFAQTDVQMDDLWAHAWTHTEVSGDQ